MGEGGCADSGDALPALAPAMQVIVLGSGGGPDETNTTAFLVRSLASGWSKGSIVAVDAGVHLGAINRILEATQPPGLARGDLLLPHTLQDGPFKGLELPNSTPSANATHILRTLVDTYLITHPHLDHIAGFVINTAGLPGSRPKRLAGLPSTIAAFKTHIFNNVIWPNLTDENNGAGLVTYNRLVEGGSPALGDGDGRGYLEISDGLAVKVWSVSHGHCMEKHSHRGSGSSSTRFGSIDGSTSSMTAVGMGSVPGGTMSPRTLAHHNSAGPSLSLFLQQHAATVRGELAGMHTPNPGHGTGAATRGSLSMLPGGQQNSEGVCVYDSSAYFVRDMATGREVLIFGDVEPDSISLSPRNAVVWAEAAPKIASGKLAAIFIECSYDDSQTVDRLFGHLTPRYINQEMAALASEVASLRAAMAREGRERKRKRQNDAGDEFGILDGAGAALASGGGGGGSRRKTTTGHNSNSNNSGAVEDPVSPRTVKPPRAPSTDEVPHSQQHNMSQQPYSNHHDVIDTPHIATPTAELSLKEAELGGGENGIGSRKPSTAADHSSAQPLRGLKVVIIHVKDRMDDKTPARDIIMQELAAHEAESRHGCEYIMSHFGQALYL